MEWTQALRRHVSRVSVDDAQAEILSWAHSPHLRDNVLHRHTYFEVCTVGRWGSGIFSLNGRPHAIQSGDIFFARPGEEHRIQNLGARRMELFWVSFSLAPASKTRVTLSPSTAPSLSQSFTRSGVAVRASDKSTLAIWNALREASQSGEIACRGVLESLARALILSLLSSGSEEPGLNHFRSSTQAIEQAIEEEHAMARLAVRYIHDNLDRRLPIEEVASHVHVSPRHLARLFRAFSGTSPADYIEAARIQRARHLLGHERLSVKQVTAAVGYADVQHFTRAFSRRAGISPAAFKLGGPVTERAEDESDMV